MRKSRHGNVALVTVGPSGLNKPYQLAGQHRIIGIGLIKVPHPVKQDGLRMLRLYGKILLEQRCIFV